jgi:hypothetical protein
MSKGWIGVDFDGTLAMHIENKPYDPAKLGEPVPAMLERVKGWLAEGKDVRIFTARIAPEYHGKPRMDMAVRAGYAIKDWCEKHLGQTLIITCTKDPDMLELWDDRAVQVERNTGVRVDEVPPLVRKRMEHAVEKYAEAMMEVADKTARVLQLEGQLAMAAQHAQRQQNRIASLEATVDEYENLVVDNGLQF